jgi:hypothetical protein
MIGTIRVRVTSTSQTWTPATMTALVAAINAALDTAVADSATPDALYTAAQGGGFSLGAVWFAPGSDGPTDIGEGARRYSA